jgi:hypothetical protein
MEDARFFHQQANWCYQLAWQCFDLAVAHKLNLMGNELTAKARKGPQTQRLFDPGSDDKVATRAGANAISNRWLTRARTVEHTPEKARPLASKLKRIFYAPRVISDHIMVQEDFERLHKFLLETEGLSEVSDDMRKLVEQEWPELVHKLPPRVPQSG